MPEIRRANLPPALLAHLLDRIRLRQISPEQLSLLAAWLDTRPVVPLGAWFKRFPGMTVCGEGELVKTFLLPGQLPYGLEIYSCRQNLVQPVPDPNYTVRAWRAVVTYLLRQQEFLYE